MVWNFSAGPAMLPPSVLARARDELCDWQGRGLSVMEVSHRGQPFMDLAAASEQRLRRLMAIPNDYAVLFLQGGASTQFALLPQNFAAVDQTIGFSIGGHWARKAMVEASLQRRCQVVEDIDGTGRQGAQGGSDSDLAYWHRTANETIDGIEFAHDPEIGSVPVFCDMSSSILSRPVDVNRYGLIYAGAQKNLGPAGLTLIVVRKDLLEFCPKSLPTLHNYRRLAESDSMANTPPTFAWYVADLVFQWIEDKGGVDEMARRNCEKANALYKYIDGSDFYSNGVAGPWRSRMNVTFSPMDQALCARFVAEAEALNMIGLKGHRAVGGLRASIYNAMPIEGVHALIEFMADFAQRNGQQQ